MTFIGKVAESLEGRVNSNTLAVAGLRDFFKAQAALVFSMCVVPYAYMSIMHVVLRTSSF